MYTEAKYWNRAETLYGDRRGVVERFFYKAANGI